MLVSTALSNGIHNATVSGISHSLILKGNVPTDLGKPDQMPVHSWRTLGWYDQNLFSPDARRDERHLCASSEGLDVGIYNVGLMWQCTPEYSYSKFDGALDHLFCESHRTDCWSGAWENTYLQGCVPDDSLFGEFFGWFVNLQDAKDW